MNNNMSYGYSSPSSFSSFSSPYSSTPGIRMPPRPRFAYSGPSSYPRPRSSASKPNPDSLSDSMVNNYGGSTNRIDSSFDDINNFSNTTLSSNNSSTYFSCNESFLSNNRRNENSYEPNISMQYPSYEGDNGIMGPNNGDFQEPKQFKNRFQGTASFLQQRSRNFQPSGTFPKFSHSQNTKSSQSNFKSLRGNFKQKNFASRQFGKARRPMDNKKQWHCAVCNIDFTSQIPLDMHLRGAKHAKKLKSRDIMNAMNNPAPAKADDPVPQGKELYCALCNVQTNSSLQLQTHLDGSKHKNKLKGDTPKDEAEAKVKATEAKVKTTETKPKTQVNGNGSITRTLPSDFGDPQPTKLMKFSCEICNISMNSSIQLSQHLASKKHQAKVEGKPLLKRKKAKEATEDLAKDESNQATEPMDTSSKDVKTVMGVQALSSSFIQAETLS